MLCGGILFSNRKGRCCFESVYNVFIYIDIDIDILQLNDSGTAHTPDTVSLCSSHQTRPKMPASVCLAALEVISFLVSICVLDMISWNALQDTQPFKYYKRTFFVGALLLFTPVYLPQVPNQLLDDECSIQCSIVQ